MGDIVRETWRRAIKCPCGKIWHTYYTRAFGWRVFAPDVCPSCGGEATKFTKTASRPVFEIVRRGILQRQKKVYVKHDIREEAPLEKK